jgi:hypothetical protein
MGEINAYDRFEIWVPSRERAIIAYCFLWSERNCIFERIAKSSASSINIDR